jgi:hypothetical protein
MNNPFMPVKFPPGPPTTVAWEDGPGAYVNPSNSGIPVRYNGQDQTHAINIRNPLPPFCTLPGAAVGYSKIL